MNHYHNVSNTYFTVLSFIYVMIYTLQMLHDPFSHFFQKRADPESRTRISEIAVLRFSYVREICLVRA